MAEKTEYEKYKEFIESNSYIPYISWAAMARIKTDKYKYAVASVFKESCNG